MIRAKIKSKAEVCKNKIEIIENLLNLNILISKDQGIQFSSLYLCMYMVDNTKPIPNRGSKG